MDYNETHKWELATDATDASDLTTGLPIDANPGDRRTVRTDGIARSFVRVQCGGGAIGGRWAYWMPWRTTTGSMDVWGQGEHPEHRVIIDRLFNSGVPNFVGLLVAPYPGRGGAANGIRQDMWVMTHPRIESVPVIYVQEPKDKIRYEHSKIVYDVETGETTTLE